MSVELYAVFTKPTKDSHTPTEMAWEIGSFADATSEATIVDHGLYWVKTHKFSGAFAGLSIRTTVASTEYIVKNFTSVPGGPTPKVVPTQVSDDAGRRGLISEDVTDWPAGFAAYYDTSTGITETGSGDVNYYPGQVAQWVPVYAVGNILKGQLVIYSNTLEDEHHYATAAADNVFPVMGVALEDIDDTEFGRVAVGGFCDVLINTTTTTKGDVLYQDTSTYTEVNTVVSPFVVGYACGPSINDGADVYIRVNLSRGVSDHGAFFGLGDDDHTQYLLEDGTRAMSGNLDMDSNEIDNVTKISRSGGNLVIDLNSASTDRILQVRNDGAGGTASMTVENDFTVGADISVGGTVDGVNIANHAASTDSHHAQTHTIVSHDTTATGANLTTLTDGSETDLHTHQYSAALQFGQRNTMTSSDYFDPAGLVSGYSGYRGYTMPTSGSIIGMSVSFSWSAQTTAGNFEHECYVADFMGAGTVVVQQIIAVDGVTYYHDYDIYAPGTYTFNAGDNIVPYGRLASGLAGSWKYGISTVYVVFDTA
jgi:hypothetical protein